MSQAVLLRGGTVVTCDDDMRVFDGDVLVRDGQIVALGARIEATADVEVVDVRGMLVHPGFVQTHVHLCQVLFRGHAEDRPLLSWLGERIWPLEAAHDPSSLAVSAELGIAELLRGGTTTCLDMGTVHHTNVLFEVAARMGFRLVSGKAMMDTPSHAGLQQPTDTAIGEARALAEQFHGASDGRLRYAFAPRFILSCSERLMRETAKLSRRLGTLLHTHSSENPAEIQAVLEATGQRNIHALHALGYTGRDVVLAHCVHVDDDERALLANTGTRVAHCPSTNLKLASGTAPIPAFLQAGIGVGIGADGAPCNNRLSMWTEMRLAALLQKPLLGAVAMPAQDVVALATRGGAAVLGIDDQVGSLQVGKRADVVVVDTRAPHLRPRSDPYTMMVFAAESADVKHVLVDGQWRVRDRALVGVDEDGLYAAADEQLARVKVRAGIAPDAR